MGQSSVYAACQISSNYLKRKFIPHQSQPFALAYKTQDIGTRERHGGLNTVLQFSAIIVPNLADRQAPNHKNSSGVGRRRPLQHGPGLSSPESLRDRLYSCMFDCRSVCLKANCVSKCVRCQLSHLHIYLPDFLSYYH